MLKDTLFKEVQKDIPVIKAALPDRKEILVIRSLIVIGVLCVAVFLIWFFEKNRVDHPLLYWPLTIALLFKFFKLLHEWYHYWGIGRLAGRKEPAVKAHAPAFTVDVMTTACPGEPHEMIKTTLLAMKNIRYPHETYLGDEGNDPELRAFCLANGIHHISRNHRTNAKAGNINNILAQSQGDICLVLDPDHEPHPLFLDRVLPYFEDEQIGFVQSVQAYKNQKTSLVAFGAAEQTYHFYGPLMMSMSNYGTAQAIGANCVFRREALDSIGGHAAGLAEDMHTSMLLHAKGWKSVYVPEILSRGKVPSTLSAFYKQQLKWSRGTLELLFFVLPKIWSNLSWRQRFHYLTLPFYYLAAFIILIDLAVPVISLLIGRTPWLVSLDRFMIFLIPVVCLTILIRQYAQRWLLEHQERGFVLTGGLLKLGAWWVYLLGFFTTILRVKIPYIPTPKEDEPENELRLNIPNILVAGLCLFAVVYGLNQDLSPYSLVMAAFSLVNAGVLLVNVLISQQKSIEYLKRYLRGREQVHYRSKRLRIYWWKLRHSLYYLIRTRALILLVAVMVFVGLYTNWVEKSSLQATYFGVSPVAEEALYKGIYMPAIRGERQMNNLPDMLADTAAFDPAIISFYWPWGEGENFPANLLHQIYQEDKIPMITWDPWDRMVEEPQESDDLLAEILSGGYDAYLRRTARQLARLEKPVFIRFGHAFDNTEYPWSAAILNNPEQFKQTWQYVVDVFRHEGAFNAIWVYNPLEPAAFETFYPGDTYVDWLGVTVRDYESRDGKSKNNLLQELYSPFKKRVSSSPRLRRKPVMLAEIGSSGREQEKAAWQEDVEFFLQNEEQVKGLIYYDAGVNNSLYAGDSAAADTEGPFSARAISSFGTDRQRAADLLQHEQNKEEASNTRIGREMPDHMRAVVYHPVSYWNQSYLPLTKYQLEKDFEKMRALKLNTIYRPVTDIYDRNVYHTARRYQLNIIQQLSEQTISFVSQADEYEHLLAWSVGEITMDNSAFWSPERQYDFKEELLRLDALAAAVKGKDDRPVIGVVNYSTLLRAAPLLFRTLAHIDVIGISVPPGEDVEAIDSIWQYYQPSQEYFIKIAQQEIGSYPDEGISVSDRQGALFFQSLQQKSPGPATEYKGFVYQHWMDRNLGIPEGGMVNPQGDLKYCFLDSMMPETEIFLYSNDPEHALKRGKLYQFYAVSDHLSSADTLSYEWRIFDKFTGEEEDIEPYSARQNSIYFSPSENSTYQIILSTRKKQAHLYNSYLEVKVP